ncbi:MAG: hypothetical protein MHM6MM_007254 [Cercozoa sp. M6MM]
MAVAGGLIDLSSLDRVVRQLQQNLQAHSHKILALEKELALRPTHEQLFDLRDTLNRKLEGVEARLDGLEQKQAKNEKHIAKLLELPQILSDMDVVLARKAEQSAVNTRFNTIHGETREQFAALRLEVARKRDFVQLKEQNALLLQKLIALEGSIAVKVDRLEVPLLQDRHNEVQQLRQDLQQLQQRAVSQDELQEQLDAKEDKNLGVRRMQQLAEQLTNKCSRGEVEALDERLTRVMQQLSSSEQTQQQRAKQLEDSARTLRQHTLLLQQIQEAQASLRASSDSFVSKSVIASDIDAAVEQLRRELESSSNAANARLQQHEERLAEAGADLSRVKQLHDSVQKKMRVVMRFIDWYSQHQPATGSTKSTADYRYGECAP